MLISKQQTLQMIVTFFLSEWFLSLFKEHLFHKKEIIIDQRNISGSPYAMWMNTETLGRMVGQVDLLPFQVVLKDEDAIHEMVSWLDAQPENDIWLGSGFDRFDRPLLKSFLRLRLPDDIIPRRVLDIGNFFWEPGHKIPGLDSCAEALGGEKRPAAHNAVEDCLITARCFLKKRMGVDVSW